jgi:hypothetical protein
MSITPTYPGVFIEEIGEPPKTIAGVSTSVAAFVDCFDRPIDCAVEIHSFAELARKFGSGASRSPAARPLELFFLNGGRTAWLASAGTPHQLRGAVDRLPPFDLLCVPWVARAQAEEQAIVTELVAAAAACCERRRALLVLDTPAGLKDAGAIGRWLRQVGVAGRANVAAYFPQVRVAGTNVAASGAVAGVYARVDAALGIWNAPAGEDAPVRGIDGLAIDVDEVGGRALDAAGVNAVHTTAGTTFAASALTLAGSDSEWRYVPVRRLALFIEESLDRGTSWAAFEPNDEALWERIRLEVGEFLHKLSRRGAFERHTVDVRSGLGIVEIVVAFAPLGTAEFVDITIQQLAGAYGNFRYRIRWRGRYVAGIGKALALERRRSPYEPVTLERGVTRDPEFEQWSSKVAHAPASEVRVDIHDERGGFLQAYAVHSCRPSEYQAMPDLDAGANAVTIENLKLVHARC